VYCAPGRHRALSHGVVESELLSKVIKKIQRKFTQESAEGVAHKPLAPVSRVTLIHDHRPLGVGDRVQASGYRAACIGVD
jgi:hypothetical protein